jgi:type IV pilus assembly protein PilO
MALTLSGDKRSTSILLILAALGVGYVAYDGLEMAKIGGLKAQKTRIAAIQDTVKQLEAQTDSAKKELARGTVEDLRRKLEGYRASLGLLRRLVPERNEVPNLIDDISTRAKIRGVSVSDLSPLPEQAGPAPFSTFKYNMKVMGHYDQIGEFLADVASLQRVIVPTDLVIAPATSTAAKALGDSSGALLEARFQIRTYVKSAAEGDPSGT